MRQKSDRRATESQGDSSFPPENSSFLPDLTPKKTDFEKI